jgi:hypothetical protein
LSSSEFVETLLDNLEALPAKNKQWLWRMIFRIQEGQSQIELVHDLKVNGWTEHAAQVEAWTPQQFYGVTQVFAKPEPETPKE